MYLSSRDIQWAIECGHLIVEPRPEDFSAGYDETSIDLHLGPIEDAKVWDVDRFESEQQTRGGKGPELGLGSFNYSNFSGTYLVQPPPEESDSKKRERQLVCLRGRQVILKPGGFLLWMTQEKVGTPILNPTLIAFVNAKSTKARTGIIVHFTAPTIHAGWSGRIVLEIANYGPFHLVLEGGDAIAQLTVAKITSSPDLSLKKSASQTHSQIDASGSPQQRPAG
jgi:dCTP deaminase